jgi:ADP-ribose pyrophosphatase
MPLPPLPSIALSEIEDISPPDNAGGYLRLRRLRLAAEFPGHGASEPFVYDSVERTALDAVVIAAHFTREGERWVYLRSAVRPPAQLRPLAQRPLPEKDTLGVLWELPAGLVEAGECSAAGLVRTAARELEEELGFSVEVGRFEVLGPATFPSAGVIGERHHYFEVTVHPDARRTPAEDGSVLERHALIAAIPLSEALALCRRGEIEDSKTEIALRRLNER